MCGIVGVIDMEGRLSTADLQQLTVQMRDRMVHRGPDDAGLWTSEDGRVCFGHRRLSVIDLRAEGRQPMSNENGDVAVTFNGEIYNFAELRQELEAAGHSFRSRTDTEVLCHLFEGADDPAGKIRKLSGMFAFAAFDQSQREVVLARDAFGKKPLYYLHQGGWFAFASELRSLQPLGRMLGGIDPAAVQQFLLLQYVHAPRTIYRQVHKLEPGSFLRLQLEPGRCHLRTPQRYFTFRAHEPRRNWFSPSLSLAQASEQLRERLLEATRARLVSDVPVGAFLSGGNDSSLVVAMMAKELAVKTQTFSIGFANSPASEHTAAAEIARILGTEHHELLVQPKAVEMLPTIVAALDEPNGDSSCLPVYLLSEFARQRVTVALSGDGGDEMFGGYGRYTHTYRESRNWSYRLRWLKAHQRRWSASEAYLGNRILPMTVPTLQHLVGPLLPEVEEFVAQMGNRISSRGRQTLHSLRNLDAETYLPGAVLAKVDRMSMQFALEVRSPLLDRQLACWAEALPAQVMNDTKIAKRLLKKLALRYLPREIVYRPKQGFGLPDQCWSQDVLLDLADSLCVGSGSRLGGYLETTRLRQHLHEQRRPEQFNVYQIWNLLVLEQWLRKSSEVSTASALAA